MHLRQFFASGIIFFFLFGCASVPDREVTQSQPPTPLLDIVYSQHVQGEFEPCGCAISPQGGIERTQNFVTGLRAKNPSRTWFFLGGATFVKSDKKISASTLGYVKNKAKHMIQGFNAVSPKAYLPSLEDFRLGFTAISELKRESNFPWVLSNVLVKNPSPLPWQDYLWLEENGYSVLIIGVVDAPTGAIPGLAFEVLNLKTTFEKIRNKLTAIPDLIVVLSSVNGEKVSQALASWGVATIILGDEVGRSTDTVQQKELNQIYFSPTNLGQSLAHVQLERVKGIKAFFIPELAASRKEAISLLQSEVEFLNSKTASRSDKKRITATAQRLEKLKSWDSRTTESDTKVIAKYVSLDQQWSGANSVTKIVDLWKNEMAAIAVSPTAKKH